MADQSEAFAFEIIRRVTGHDVRHIDDGSRARMVDGAWTDEGGRRHVVEVTRLMPPHMGQLLSLLNGRDYKLPAELVSRRWSASVEPTVDLRTLDSELDLMLTHCERVGLRHLADLPWRELEKWPLGKHVQAGDLDAWCRDAPSPGYIEVLPPGRGGGAGGMEVVPPWLSRQLETDPLLVEKVEKLRQWDADQRHLFIGVHRYGVPFAVGYAFWNADAIPTTSPTLPDGLDGVWMAPAVNKPPLTWLRGRGWERQYVLEGTCSQ